MPFPELNLKQAWLIPSAVALPNPNGTAPGWFVERPDGRVIVALPGPPREMRPMWSDHVVPRLHEGGLGAEVASRTYRLAGIGESQVAERLGETILRATNPIVATYARVEAVDVRVSAVAEGRPDGRGARGGRLGRGPRPSPRPRLGHRRDDLEPGDRRAPRRAWMVAGGGRDRDRRQPQRAARRRAMAPLRRIDRRSRARPAAEAHGRAKTSRRYRLVGLASSVVPMSGSRSGRDHGPAIPPSRSRSSRRAGSDASDASSS